MVQAHGLRTLVSGQGVETQEDKAQTSGKKDEAHGFAAQDSGKMVEAHGFKGQASGQRLRLTDAGTKTTGK